MKKQITNALLLLSLLSPLLAGCGQKEYKPEMYAADGHMHNFEFNEGSAPETCAKQGWRNYYTCTECSNIFDEHYNIVEMADLKYSLPHTLTHVDKIESTKTETGIYEHYHCSVCNKNFEDPDGKKVLNKIVMPVKSNYIMDEVKYYRAEPSLYEVTEEADTLTLVDNDNKANSFAFFPSKKNAYHFRASVEIEWEVAESFGLCLKTSTRHVLCGLIPYDNVNFIRYAYGSTTDFNRSFYRGSFEELNKLGAGIATLENGRHKATLTLFRDDDGLRLYCGNYRAWFIKYNEDPQSILYDDSVTVGVMYRPNRYSVGSIVPTLNSDGTTTFTCTYNYAAPNENFIFNARYNESKTALTDIDAKTTNGKAVSIREDGMIMFDGKACGFFAYQFNEDGSLLKDTGYTCKYSNLKIVDL